MPRMHAVPERVLDSFSGKWTASETSWRVARADDPRMLSPGGHFVRVVAKKKEPRGFLGTQY